jgi:Mg2+/Co2+ transporter CorC
MKEAGWIVALVLALLGATVFLLRHRLAEAMGYVRADQAGGEEPQRGNGTRDDRQWLGERFELDELEVSDVMVHRTNMRSLNADNPPEAIVREILQSPNTRIPLWRGSLDNIVGVLHAKDVLRALDEAGNDLTRVDLMKFAEKPWFVPDTTTLQEQLNAFLRRKAHFAIVVDEYGEVEGLVTLGDIIEEIVGEIADESDIDLAGVKKEADGSVVVDGTVPIRDLNRALDWDLPDEEATTIAGLVIHETQSIPDEKQAFTFHGKRFVVMKRDKNRIARLRIRPVDEAQAVVAALCTNDWPPQADGHGGYGPVASPGFRHCGPPFDGQTGYGSCLWDCSTDFRLFRPLRQMLKGASRKRPLPLSSGASTLPRRIRSACSAVRAAMPTSHAPSASEPSVSPWSALAANAPLSQASAR